MSKKSVCTAIFLALFFVGLQLMVFGQTPAATTIMGGRGGNPFTDSGISYGARVSEVHVFSGDYVDAVQMVYTLANGQLQSSSRRGGSGGRQNIFRLDSDEYIVGLSGRYGEYIDSIQIHTNKRTSPSYGGRGGSQEYQVGVASGNYAVGFSGRSGKYLDAIGLIYLPIPRSQANQDGYYGGRGGNPFADPALPPGARISAVRVYSGDYVDGLQLVYTLSDGRTTEGALHGNRSGRRNDFNLDANEYLIGISGRYGKYVDSLTIRTNRRTSPAYGGRGGEKEFSVQANTGNMVTGFSGRSGKYLDAIDINQAPISSSFRLPGRFRVQ
jgi:hypothetical protein